MKHKSKKFYIKVWSDGRYVDLWSSTHFLAGAVITGFFVIADVPFWTGVIILFLLLIFWEIYEQIKKFRETITNTISDLILGLTGAAAMYITMDLEIFNNMMLFLVITVLCGLLLLWGWIAYKLGSSDDFLKRFG